MVVWTAGTQSSTCHNVGRNDGHILDSLIVHDMDWLQAQYVRNCSLCGAYLTCRIFGSWLYFLYDVNVIYYDTFFLDPLVEGWRLSHSNGTNETGYIISLLPDTRSTNSKNTVCVKCASDGG